MNLIKSNHDTHVRIVTIALLMATIISAIEGTIVATAMPTIVADLDNVYGMNWVFSTYLLTNSIMMPIYGKLSDQFGRKRVFIIGLTIFIISSLLSGAANSMTTLIIYRAIQGIGAGVILPIANTIIADLYSFQNRAKIMGLNNSIWSIASVLAPLLGGFIVDNFGWRWIFWFNVPIGGLIILMIVYGLKEQTVKKKHSIDYIGIIYFIIVICSIMGIIDALGKRAISMQTIAFELIVFVVSSVMFSRRENSVDEPLIPMKLFKSTTFVVQNLIVFVISGYLIALNVYLPDWVQGLLGYRAIFSGLAMAPVSLMWIVGSFIASWLINKLYPKQITNIGLLFVIVGALSMTLISKGFAFVGIGLISAISGLGLGIIITNTTVSVQNEVGSQNVGVATSFNTLSRNLGQILFITVLGIIMNTSLRVGSLQTDHPKKTLRMMSELINPKTADLISPKVAEQLKAILFSSLHNVFVFGLILIVIIYIINLFDWKNQKQN